MGSLPEHIVLHIFQFLPPSTAENSNKEVSDLESTDSVSRFIISKIEWPYQQTNYSLVNKTWYRAASHDNMWKSACEQLVSHLNSDKPATTYNDARDVRFQAEMPSPSSSSTVAAEEFMYRRFYLDSIKRIQKEAAEKYWFTRSLEKTLNIKKNVAFKRSLFLFITLLIIVQIVLAALHDALKWPRWAWSLVLIPSYLIGVLSLFPYLMSYGLLLLTSYKTNGLDLVTGCVNLFFLPVFLGPPIMLMLVVASVAVNLSLVPFPTLEYGITDPEKLAAWDRRWGLIPWHVPLAPFILMCSLKFFVDLRMILRSSGATKKMEEIKGIVFSIGFGLLLLLLGLHLEFTRLPLPLVFIPAYLSEMIQLMLCVGQAIHNCKVGVRCLKPYRSMGLCCSYIGLLVTFSIWGIRGLVFLSFFPAILVQVLSTIAEWCLGETYWSKDY